ncbi:MAG: mechanosensitive ion channel family protein [Gammaproteobacteria bacterium]
MELLRNLNQVTALQIAAIVAVTWMSMGLTQRLLPWLAEQFSGHKRLYILAAVPVFRLLFIIVATVMIIPRIVEPTMENLVALLGTVGVALGFAFKDYVSSLAAGIVTLYEMPYRVGDWIKVEDAYGEVKEIGMRAVEIVTPDDTVVTIPHLKLWTTHIYNSNDGSRYLMCVTDFYLHPRHSANQVKACLLEVVLTSVYLQFEKPVTVLIQEKPWGTHYRIKAYPIETRDQFVFITDLTVRGKAALTELGVEFAAMPFPFRESE